MFLCGTAPNTYAPPPPVRRIHTSLIGMSALRPLADRLGPAHKPLFCNVVDVSLMLCD